MTKELLEQYPDICAELREVERKLREPVSDTVSGSSANFPYTQHAISVQGIPPRLIAQRDMLANLKEEIEGFIRSLPNSRMRRIVDYRVLQGMSWEQVAAKMGHRVSVDGVKYQYYGLWKSKK